MKKAKRYWINCVRSLSEHSTNEKIPVAKAFVCPWKVNDKFVYRHKNLDKYMLIAVERFLKCNAEIKCLVDILPVTFFKYLLFIWKVSKMLITLYFFQGGLTNQRVLWNSGVCGSKVDLKNFCKV